MMGYIPYGIMLQENAKGVSQVGIGSHPIEEIQHQELVAIASAYEEGHIDATRANLEAFRNVLCELVSVGPVLPFAFGILTPSLHAMKTLLRMNYAAALQRLQFLTDKVQFTVRVTWSDLKSVLEEVLEEHQEIRARRDDMVKHPTAQTASAKIGIGQMVAEVVEEKKRRESDKVKAHLRSSVLEFMEEVGPGESHLVTLEALLERGRESQFESVIHDLDRKTAGRYTFCFQGPQPPLSFSSISLKVPA